MMPKHRSAQILWLWKNAFVMFISFDQVVLFCWSALHSQEIKTFPFNSVQASDCVDERTELNAMPRSNAITQHQHGPSNCLTTFFFSLKTKKKTWNIRVIACRTMYCAVFNWMIKSIEFMTVQLNICMHVEIWISHSGIEVFISFTIDPILVSKPINVSTFACVCVRVYF